MQSLSQARKTAKAINSLFGNPNIEVSITGTRAWSAGGKINIPMLDFTNPDALAMTDGYIDHECGHESDTEHHFMALARARYKKMGKSVLNALEDARMEEQRSKLFPGARINLHRTWELAVKRGLVQHPSNIDQLASLLFSYILNHVRHVVNGYTTYSAEALVLLKKEFDTKFLDSLTYFIEETVKAKSTSDCWDSTCKIMDLINDEQDQREDEENSDPDDDDNSESDDDENSESDDDENSESDDDENSESDDDENSESDDDENSESDDDDNSDPDDDENSDPEDDENSDPEDDDNSESDNDENSESDDDDNTESDDDENSDSDDDDNAESDDDENSESNDDEGSSSDDDDNSESNDDEESVYVESPINEIENEEDYHGKLQEALTEMAEEYEVEEDSLPVNFLFADEELGRIHQLDDWRGLSSKFARTLQRVLIDQSEHLKFASVHGRQLIGRQLASIPCGNNMVFEKKSDVDAPRSSVYLLIDASGSMDGRLMMEANKTALAFAKAFQRLQIDVEVTYFGCMSPTVREDSLYKAKSFNSKLIPSRFNVEAWGNTPTEDGLMYALIRMINQPSDNKIVFVVTDGDPNNPTRVKQAASLIKDAGIKLIPIGLGTDRVAGLEKPVFAKTSEDVNQALKDAIKQKLFN